MMINIFFSKTLKNNRMLKKHVVNVKNQSVLNYIVSVSKQIHIAHLSATVLIVIIQNMNQKDK